MVVGEVRFQQIMSYLVDFFQSWLTDTANSGIVMPQCHIAAPESLRLCARVRVFPGLLGIGLKHLETISPFGASNQYRLMVFEFILTAFRALRCSQCSQPISGLCFSAFLGGIGACCLHAVCFICGLMIMRDFKLTFS